MTGYLSLDWCILIEILKWTCTKQWRCSYLLRHEGQILDNFKKFLSIKVIKIVLDSMLYETLKWPQIAPFCISSKQITDPLPFSRIMACTLLSLSYAPGMLCWICPADNEYHPVQWSYVLLYGMLHLFLHCESLATYQCILAQLPGKFYIRTFIYHYFLKFLNTTIILKYWKE